MFKGRCEANLRDARAIIAAQDSTIAADNALVNNEAERADNCERQYRDLDRRTVRKSALPWYVIAGLIAGYLLAQ